MIRDLIWKPDFSKTVDRFEAWWQGAIVDRPPVTLYVHPPRAPKLPASAHGSQRERSLDVEYTVRAAIAHLECEDWTGDRFPCFWSNVGPEVTATWFGCELEFGPHTAWSTPVVHQPEDWKRIIAMEPDFNNVYWKTVERATELALALSHGRYVVGMTDLHGSYDMLAALREPMYLCTDLLDCPDLVEAAGKRMATAYVEGFMRQWRMLSAAGHGSTTWCPIYHEGPAYVPSCDFWCMVSPQIAREIILPTLITEMAPLQRSIFHLDGPQALKHLDLMLELPGLNAVQWVYGDGHGPAAQWIRVYRHCQAAGKSLQILAANAADALTVLQALKPEGLWLSVAEAFDSAASANAFLAEVSRIAAR